MSPDRPDELHKKFADNQMDAREPCASGRASHKEKVGSAVEPEWASTVLRQLINQPLSKHLSLPPPPPSSCKCSAMHSGRQESAGSHRRSSTPAAQGSGAERVDGAD
ncbi:unnamed protein product [Pleuronectes platessa]|uniref:Uncharacterized protein n=1 Tax=Pleuronectes platessa TaxID=8262 RepID=A0A9N7TK15_PLEPL|nr:unnamed protein product [Pleuronectes platessa]